MNSNLRSVWGLMNHISNSVQFAFIQTLHIYSMRKRTNMLGYSGFINLKSLDYSFHLHITFGIWVIVHFNPFSCRIIKNFGSFIIKISSNKWWFLVRSQIGAGDKMIKFRWCFRFKGDSIKTFKNWNQLAVYFNLRMTLSFGWVGETKHNSERKGVT